MASLHWKGNRLWYRWREKWHPAGQVELLNDKWLFFLTDLDNPQVQMNVGTYSSAEEARKIVPKNPALSLMFSKWTARQKESGFLAMQYEDVELEQMASNHMKPVVRSLGYNLQDMRDISQAGVIDNLLREALRGAKFVIADLTHGNNGAYWEAGFAEALGKPVIYTCEQRRFEEVQTHFNTNHCTTVMWSSGDTESFRGALSGALRRSLGMAGDA